jgi:hypothetical protein
MPAMSVVIVTPDCYETIRRTMRHLRAQTVAERLEIVIVFPSRADLGLIEEDLVGFQGHRLVEVRPFHGMDGPRAVGIRQTRAPVIALAEDHCYPDPGWAEALLEAHKESWAAVAPGMTNANPRSLTSWIQLFMTYGRWVEPKTAGTIDDLPGHNSSYKRAALLDYGPDLERMLQVVTLMHHDLKAKGYQLYVEPAAKVYHLNITRPVPFLRDHFVCGRWFAAGRAAPWCWPRRLLYAGGVPLLLLRYLRGHLREIRRAGRHRELIPRGLPILLAGLAARGVGEVLGFSLGLGRAKEWAMDLETRRLRFISSRDRADLAAS